MSAPEPPEAPDQADHADHADQADASPAGGGRAGVTWDPVSGHHGWGGGLRTWAWRLGLGVVVGVLSGVSSAVFLTSLEWATDTRLAHGWLLFGLPFAGLAMGLAYHHGGKGSAAGNNLILDEIHEPRAWVPRRMAGMVLVGTIGTHLFGGSGGREGAAVQMAGSLTDGLNRRLGITGAERRILLLAAIGGGFASVFGVPFAGIVFALEVQAVGALRWKALLPTVAAAAVGDRVVRLAGVHHSSYPSISVDAWSAGLVGKVVLAGVAFGLTSVLFAESVHRIKDLSAKAIAWPPLRPFVGGVAVIGLVYAVGTRDYLGLSIPLITAALAGGAGIATGAFALKLLFTAVTLGSGFQGGEVTPLFVIGSTLGVTLGHALGVPIPLMAALGFVAVFAGATNTPLACVAMGVELFGWGPVALLVLVCAVSYVSSGPGGIYLAQRTGHPLRWGFRHQPTAPDAT